MAKCVCRALSKSEGAVSFILIGIAKLLPKTVAIIYTPEQARSPEKTQPLLVVQWEGEGLPTFECVFGSTPLV